MADNWWDALTTRIGDVLAAPQQPWGAMMPGIMPAPDPNQRANMIGSTLLSLGQALSQGARQRLPLGESLGAGFQAAQQGGQQRQMQQLQMGMLGSKIAGEKRKNETVERLTKMEPPPGWTRETWGPFVSMDPAGAFKVYAESVREGQFRASAGTPSWLPGGGGGTGGAPAPTGGVFDIPQQFAPQVTAAATKHGVPPQLLASTFWNESRWNPNAVNKNDQGRGVDSVGIGQWGEQWAKARGFDPRDPNASIEHTAAAMKEYATKYGGNWMLARLAYGWGPGNVDKWLQAGGDPAKLPDGARVWLPRTAFGIADDQQARAAFPQVAEMLRPGPARGPWGDAQIPPMQTAGVTQPNPAAAGPPPQGFGYGPVGAPQVRGVEPAQYTPPGDGFMPPSVAGSVAPIVPGQAQLPPTAAPVPNVGQPGATGAPSLGTGVVAPPVPAEAPSPVLPAQAAAPAQGPVAPAAGPPQAPARPVLTDAEVQRDPIIRQAYDAYRNARTPQDRAAADARGAARRVELEKEARARAARQPGQDAPATPPPGATDDPKWQELERRRLDLTRQMRSAHDAGDVALVDKLGEQRSAVELEQARRVGTLADRPEELRRAEAQGARRAQIQQDTELFKEDVKDASKFASDIQNNALKSRSARANIQQLGALLEGMNTGRFTNTVVDIKRMAKGIGIDLGVADTVPQAEAARALIGQMALMLRDPSSGAGMPGAMSDADRTFLNSMVPGLETTPEGRKLMLAFMGRLHNYNIGLAKAVQDYRLSPEWKTTPQGIVRVAQQYADANPIFSEADVAAVRKVSGATSVPTNPRPEQEAPAGPPPAAIEHLRSNPALAPQFDEKYGPGASQRVLGR